jgi:hypothetical protein
MLCSAPPVFIALSVAEARTGQQYDAHMFGYKAEKGGPSLWGGRPVTINTIIILFSDGHATHLILQNIHEDLG